MLTKFGTKLVHPYRSGPNCPPFCAAHSILPDTIVRIAPISPGIFGMGAQAQGLGRPWCLSIMSAMTERMNSSASSVMPPATPP